MFEIPGRGEFSAWGATDRGRLPPVTVLNFGFVSRTISGAGPLEDDLKVADCGWGDLERVAESLSLGSGITSFRGFPFAAEADVDLSGLLGGVLKGDTLSSEDAARRDAP